jgi:multicomponent Na+:H+ antiporter subunit F
MITSALIAMMVVMLMLLARACMGPTLYDRILAINTFGTATVLTLAILGFFMGRPDFLDIALLYALINFIGTIAVLKIYRYGNLGGQDGPIEDSVNPSEQAVRQRAQNRAENSAENKDA